MGRPASSRVLRATSAFLAAAGVVLAILVAGLVVREIVSPPTQTWSAWTRGAILAISVVAISFCVLGGLLSFHLHRARRDSVRAFLSGADRERITAAIRAAEAKTSGEIVVHLADRAHDTPIADAREAFERIGMTRTRERNGVLFFVSVRDRKLAVVGDQGIHEHVKQDFWNDVIHRVEGHFADGRFGEGLAEGIERVGSRLALHFPRRADDVNELSDETSRDGGDAPRR